MAEDAAVVRFAAALSRREAFHSINPGGTPLLRQEVCWRRGNGQCGMPESKIENLISKNDKKCLTSNNTRVTIKPSETSLPWACPENDRPAAPRIAVEPQDGAGSRPEHPGSPHKFVVTGVSV